MSSLFVKGKDAERAAEYRRRAQRVLRHAATASDDRIRAWFIDVAKNYATLAEHIEQRMERRRARTRSVAIERWAISEHVRQQQSDRAN
jgi:hypothetical protein